MVPMLCVPKKNGTLCTVFNLHLQNENTMIDVTPLLDQDLICSNVAHCRYQTKLNMSKAYEQIQICPDHVVRTAFATVLGTFRSQVI